MQKIRAVVTRPASDMRVLATWFSTGTKLLGVAVILPIAIVKLSEIELNFWLIGLVAINIINLIEFAITPNTVRQLSYQRGMEAGQRTESIATAAYTLHRTAAICVALVACMGIFLQLDLSEKAGTVFSPLVWIIPVLLYFKLLTAYYAAVLHTNDRIPYHRVIEATANIAVTLLTIAVLTVTTDVALLLCMQIIPQAIIFPIIRKASKRHQKVEEFGFSSLVVHRDEIVAPALNQLSASLFGFGAVQIVALYINATNTTSYANAFLLSLRMIQSTSTFTNPFFYTFIPQLARVIRSKGVFVFRDLANQKKVFSISAFVVVNAAVTFAIIVIHFNDYEFKDKLPSLGMWITLSIAFTFHRVGAMNLQTSALMGHVQFQTAELIATAALFVQVALLYIFWDYQNVPVNFLVTYVLVYFPITIWIRRQAESRAT